KPVGQPNMSVAFLLARGGPRKLTDEQLNPYRAPFPYPDDRVGIARFPQLIPQTKNQGHESWATMAHVEDGLARLREKPALICWALKDRAFRKQMLERWQHVFTRVDGPHLLPEAGHFLQEDAPDAILDRIERWAAAL